MMPMDTDTSEASKTLVSQGQGSCQETGDKRCHWKKHLWSEPRDSAGSTGCCGLAPPESYILEMELIQLSSGLES